MIPFKGLISHLRGGSAYGAHEGEHHANFERKKETLSFKRFSSVNDGIGRNSSGAEDDNSSLDYGVGSCSSSSRNEWTLKLKQGVESNGESHDDVTFWSWTRIWSNVGLKGGLWQELSGALGDAGSFLPSVLALALVNGLDLGTTLLFTGIFNLATGLLFGIPLPVQPMSAITLAALSPNPLTIPQIMAAGLITGLVLATLGITGMMDFFYRLIPIPVVRGVMMCEGLTTGFRAVKYIVENQDLTTMQSLGTRSWLGINGLILPISMLLFLVVVCGVGKSEKEEVGSREWLGSNGESGRESFLSRGSSSLHYRYKDDEAEQWNWRRAVLSFPTALIVLLTALSLAIASNPSIVQNLKLGPNPLKRVEISSEDWKVGLLQAAVYQIPVSILSSVISVSKLSSDYFPGQKVTPKAMCLSVWMMNLLGCCFGAVPVCHGAGGLAGQYKFGARSGLSMLLLGSMKLFLGLLFGSSLVGILSLFPMSLLGILLLASGLELATVCRDQSSRQDALVMLAIAVVSIGTSTTYNTSAGFVCGLILYLVVKLHERLEN